MLHLLKWMYAALVFVIIWIKLFKPTTKHTQNKARRQLCLSSTPLSNIYIQLDSAILWLDAICPRIEERITLRELPQEQKKYQIPNSKHVNPEPCEHWLLLTPPKNKDRILGFQLTSSHIRVSLFRRRFCYMSTVFFWNLWKRFYFFKENVFPQTSWQGEFIVLPVQRRVIMG